MTFILIKVNILNLFKLINVVAGYQMDGVIHSLKRHWASKQFVNSYRIMFHTLLMSINNVK